MVNLFCCAMTTLLLSGVTTDLCRKACDNDVRCGGWLLNKAGECLRCDGGASTNPSSACDSVGEEAQGDKGCTASNECVICDPVSAPPGQAQVLRKLASGHLRSVSVFVSSTCKNYREGTNATFGRNLVVRARKDASLEGGHVASVDMEAKNAVAVTNVSSDDIISVKAIQVTAEGLAFNGLHSGLVVHDVDGLDAKISRVSNPEGVCGGVVNSRGDVSMSECSCGGDDKHTLIVQQPLSSPSLALDMDTSCQPVLDVSKEFGMFGRDYEIRVFNNGVFGAHQREHDMIERMLPVAVATLAVLIVLLPFCHPAARKLLGVIGGRGKLKGA